MNNLEEVVQYLNNKYSGQVTLSTNSTLITEENVNLLCDSFVQIDISVDGVTEEKCDAIRGKGTFKKVLNSIELLKKNNAKLITLSIALNNETINDKQTFIDLCEKIEVKPLIRYMSMLGRAKNNQVDSNEIVDFMEASCSNITQCYDCAGGVNDISVNYKGDVFPCNLFVDDKYKIGNILEGDLMEKFERNKKHSWFEAFSEYTPDFREECKNCEVNIFCWNCASLARVFLDTNRIENLKEICKPKYDRIMEVLWDE